MVMSVREVMTKNPACCTPDSKLTRAARMMLDEDCGAIPVIESESNHKLVGVLTDRDIVCRAVAKEQNPLEMTVGSCMSTPAVTISPDASLEECCQHMTEHQIRRIPVVDQEGVCCGVVAQADVAANASSERTAEVVKEVSEP